MPNLRRFIALLLIAMSFGGIFHAYSYGVKNGYDTKIAYGFEHDAWSAAVAISRLAYDFHEGYYGYTEVVREMTRVLAPQGVHASKPDFLSDRAKIEEAFDQATHMDKSKFPVYKEPNGNFTSLFAEDVGFADFYTLAFVLFGYKADAMYKLYFLTFTLSAIIFVAGYHRKLLPLSLLALLCISFNAFFFSKVLSTYGMPSVNGNRFASTLGYIPMLYLFSMLWMRPDWNRRTVALLAAQAVIFSFALSIRMTTKWQLMICILLALLIAAHAWYKAMPAPKREKLKQAVRPTFVMATLIFAGTFLTYGLVQRTQLHPIYFTDCVQPYHMTWHSVILGLNNHPQFDEFSKEFTDGKGGDAIAWNAYQIYQKERGLSYSCPESGGRHKVRDHERVMRILFFEFVKKHPQFAWELFTHYKPRNIFYALKAMLNNVHPTFWQVIFGLSAAAGVGAALLSTTRRRMPWGLLSLMALGLVFSSLPHMAAYPNQIMVDLFWMSILNACVWVAALCYRLLPIWRRRA